MQIKKHLTENYHNYENVALFCYQNNLNINATESWLKGAMKS